jgi:hypothetical protein
LYQALRRAGEQLAETIDQDDWLRKAKARTVRKLPERSSESH